jgi:hypothetical protein
MSNYPEDLVQHAIDMLREAGEGWEPDEVHFHLFNEDYWIIGSYKAELWLNEFGGFSAVGKVQQYEKDNFGEVSTDLGDSERVANMLAYIIGEEILQESVTLNDLLMTSEALTAEDVKSITEELEVLI